jgi:hypothetical protein
MWCVGHTRIAIALSKQSDHDRTKDGRLGADLTSHLLGAAMSVTLGGSFLSPRKTWIAALRTL